MSVLLQLRSTLEAADPRDLLLIGHDERRRLADTLRTWAYVTDEADRLTRAETMLPATLARLGPGRPPRPPRMSPRPSAQQTHCKRGHLLTDDNVYSRKDSPRRQCMACRAARQREARCRLRAARRAVLARLEAAR